MKREHSRKPDEIIPIIEACSQAPRIELFARGVREGWDMWGNQATADYDPLEHLRRIIQLRRLKKSKEKLKVIDKKRYKSR